MLGFLVLATPLFVCSGGEAGRTKTGQAKKSNQPRQAVRKFEGQWQQRLTTQLPPFPPSLTASSPVWTLVSRSHPAQSGRVIDFLYDSKLAARFVYGPGQPKPYLHVYADDGVTLLTKGESGGTYPHHRGIFIGWRDVRVGSSKYDLWHMTSGTMQVVGIERLITSPDCAIVVAQIEWRAGTSGTGALLLTEQRTIAVSKTGGAGVQVDCHFGLCAEQNLTLDGDLHHAGIHFRAPEETVSRQAETSYLMAPDGTVSGTNLQWCRLLFPIGSRWFTSVQMNAPQNPVEELSIREYGRFGYFFRRPMQAGEKLSLAYRFAVAESGAPANPPRQSSGQIAESRAACSGLYGGFVAFQDADFDGDGQTNAEERIAATNPYLSDSRFKILRVIRNGSGAPYVEFPWLPTRVYRIWRSENLSGWTGVDSPQFTFPQPEVARWTDATLPSGQQFYRVTIE